MTSVNTNYGALVALQNLSKTTSELSTVQNRINTGLKVASARDNGAVFAIAESQRTRVGGLASVRDGIDRATSAIDVGLSAGEAIGDILKQMKEKAVAAQASDLDNTQRDALQADFSALRAQINQIANAATFNGANLVNGTNRAGGSGGLYSVLTSDSSSAGGSAGFTLDGLASTTDGILSADGTLADLADGVTMSAGDIVRFTVTVSGNTETYDVGVDGADTIQDYLDAVNTATNGRVTATYDDSTGVISYNSSDDFDVQYRAAAGTANDLGFFDGTSGTSGTSMTAAAGGGGTNTVTVTGYDFRLGISSQALAGITNALDLTTGAAAAGTAIDSALTALNSAMAQLGSQAKALDIQKGFLGKLSDSLEKGIGNLVDADMAKESARLQALQVKQQLGAQALSIANQAPSIILSFFR